MGGCSATLTSPSVVDGRPDRPSRGRWRIVSDVCRECSLKSIHCSKLHDSYLSRTPRPDKFTRPSVRTRRGNHPAPPGRPPRGGAKVAWFRYSCEYRRYSRDDPGDITNDSASVLVLVVFVPEIGLMSSPDEEALRSLRAVFGFAERMAAAPTSRIKPRIASLDHLVGHSANLEVSDCNASKKRSSVISACRSRRRRRQGTPRRRSRNDVKSMVDRQRR